MEITTLRLDDSSFDSRIDLEVEEVDVCPICKHAINAQAYSSVITLEPLILGINDFKQEVLNVLFICPKCKQCFLAKYIVTYTPANPYDFGIGSYSTKLIDAFPKVPNSLEFNAFIQDISPKFIKIYNEALYAEALNLFEVAGPGYRKAFEFLIKDYLIQNSESQEDKEQIKKLPLTQCIAKLDLPQLQVVSKRVAWLGNDQTHYTPLFDEFDISHLKSMINITVSWITLLLETNEISQINPKK